MVQRQIYHKILPQILPQRVSPDIHNVIMSHDHITDVTPRFPESISSYHFWSPASALGVPHQPGMSTWQSSFCSCLEKSCETPPAICLRALIAVGDVSTMFSWIVEPGTYASCCWHHYGRSMCSNKIYVYTSTCRCVSYLLNLSQGICFYRICFLVRREFWIVTVSGISFVMYVY